MCDELENPEVEEEYLDDPVLCVHCLEEVPWDANMCVHCKAPLNYIASTDPYQRIHAEGFILRTAAEKPRSWWTVIGIWMLALSICGPYLLIVIAYWIETGTFDGIRLDAWIISGLSLMWSVVVFRCTMNFLAWWWWERRLRD